MFTKDLQELKGKQTEVNNIVKRSEVAQSCLTLCNPMDCQAPPSMGFSRQEYWSGLQGIIESENCSIMFNSLRFHGIHGIL